MRIFTKFPCKIQQSMRSIDDIMVAMMDGHLLNVFAMGDS